MPKRHLSLSMWLSRSHIPLCPIFFAGFRGDVLGCFFSRGSLRSFPPPPLLRGWGISAQHLPLVLKTCMICCGDKNYFSYYHCLAWTISAKNAEAVATCQRCPQKMRELLPRVDDIRKKCGSCCHVSTMSAKNAEAVATCR